MMAAAQAGDGDAFAVFYGRHVAAIAGFHRRRVAPPEAAFDLTAETFASLVAALDQFDPARGSARGWLFAIAANELRQAWRHQQVEDRARRELQLEPIVLDDGALEIIEARSSLGEAERALAELSASEREAIEARVLHDASYGEIAQQLRCSPSVVRQRVSRGLRKLKDRLEERA